MADYFCDNNELPNAMSKKRRNKTNNYKKIQYQCIVYAVNFSQWKAKKPSTQRNGRIWLQAQSNERKEGRGFDLSMCVRVCVYVYVQFQRA